MQLKSIISALKRDENFDLNYILDPLPKDFRIRTNTSSKPKKSAVLILLYEKDGETFTVLTQRHEYNGQHSGQISLPGGKIELEDRNLEATALRETHEEIGITPNKITIIKELKDIYVPPSNFIITPFVGYMKSPPIFDLDSHEVKELIEYPISRLLEKDVIQKTEMYFDNIPTTVNYFKIYDKIVWGATAMILEDFKRRL